MGDPIDTARIRGWTTEYGGYRHAVTTTTIESWLEQFKAQHRDIAARVLDAVDYYDNGRIASAFRSALRSLNGWHSDASKRTGRWFFVPYSGSAGESGDTMLHQFRLANGLDRKQHNYLFAYRSDLIRLKLTADDTVVFVDDITATGKQVCDVWNDEFAELVAGVGQTFLLVVVAGRGARAAIGNGTDIRLVPSHEMVASDNIFANECAFFTSAEKRELLSYCQIANAKTPKGTGDCGFLLVFQHRCPNNSVPILHAYHDKWHGVFQRHDQ